MEVKDKIKYCSLCEKELTRFDGKKVCGDCLKKLYRMDNKDA